MSLLLTEFKEFNLPSSHIVSFGVSKKKKKNIQKKNIQTFFAIIYFLYLMALILYQLGTHIYLLHQMTRQIFKQFTY